MLNRRPEATGLVARRRARRRPGPSRRRRGARCVSAAALRACRPARSWACPTDLRALAESEFSRRQASRGCPLGPLLPGRPLEDDVAVGVYVAARWAREVVDRLVEPLLGGVYAGRRRRAVAGRGGARALRPRTNDAVGARADAWVRAAKAAHASQPCRYSLASSAASDDSRRRRRLHPRPRRHLGRARAVTGLHRLDGDAWRVMGLDRPEEPSRRTASSLSARDRPASTHPLCLPRRRVDRTAATPSRVRELAIVTFASPSRSLRERCPRAAGSSSVG